MAVGLSVVCNIYVSVKLFSFELAAKFSRQGGNPVQPRFCNAKNAIFKRFKTGVSLRSPSFSSQLKRNQFYVCVYVCIRVYMCVCMCIYVYMYVYTCVCMCIGHTKSCIYTYMCTLHSYVNMQAYKMKMYTRTYKKLYAYIHVHIIFIIYVNVQACK